MTRDEEMVASGSKQRRSESDEDFKYIRICNTKRPHN